MSTTNYLRLGIIFTVTGILAVAHYFLVPNGILPRGTDLLTGVVPAVLGIPLLMVAVRRAGRTTRTERVPALGQQHRSWLKFECTEASVHQPSQRDFAVIGSSARVGSGVLSIGGLRV